MEITKEKIAYLIASRIADTGMKQREFSRKLGVAQNTVSHWVSGNAVPATDTFLKMCDVCGMTPNEFLQLEGTKCNPVEVEKIVYRDRPAEKTEWVRDEKGIWYCKACRMDAPYDSTGFQHRSRCCPYCGRQAHPDKPTVALDGKEEQK